MRLIIVTGLSGAGKTTALRALEDIGFYCVDNMPLPLLSRFVRVMKDSSHPGEDVAVSVDARQAEYIGAYDDQVAELGRAGHDFETLFLEAPDELLMRRYSETRRRHPLAGDNLQAGIARDREILSPLRANAYVLNTASLSVHELKAIMQEKYDRKGGQFKVTLLSFGFKHGAPSDADLVFDVRFLRNPYFDPELSPMDGRQKAVSDYVLDTDAGRAQIEQLQSYLEFSLPHFKREGKHYLTIAIGCTGGKHRSVATVEEINKRLGSTWEFSVRHRDVGREY